MIDAKALAQLERAPLPLRAFRARAVALAALSGVAATVAWLLSPAGRDIPELPLPYVGIDLRLIALPALFPLLHAAAAPARWPRPALVLPGLALTVAAVSHANSSALFALLGLEGAAPGDRVDLLRAAASGASLLLALGASFDRAADRLAGIAERAHVPQERVLALERAAWAHAERVLGFGGAAMVALLLAARAGDAAVGGAQAVLPELVGAGVAVVVAVLLFPGLGRRAAA
ncbi:MAG TPA: hypothetical protein VGR28_14155 [Candidatus Thermoplasmatota archaeon]|nr:hypothetical protein [Candidatus Thermoplasmatota archaeon]